MCLALGQNAVTPARLEPAAPQSQVKHSTTRPLRSLLLQDKVNLALSGDFCRLLMTFANSLEPDQDQQYVGPDLDPKHLTL